MKIALIGRHKILYDTGILLKDVGHEIGAVVSYKPRKEYGANLNDFRRLAEQSNAPFFNTNVLDKELMDCFEDIEIGISFNWPRVIEEKNIEAFELGILNSHFGDLPRYRGNACPNWAILNGEEKIFNTIHAMEGGKLDCGKVIVQESITNNDTLYIGDFYDWARSVVPVSFKKSLELLGRDPGYMLKYADQDSPKSLRCYPRREQDGLINWNESSNYIHRLIRASSRPYPGAYSFLEGKKLTIWKGKLNDDNENYFAVPGQICEVGEGYFTVISGNGKVRVDEWECEKRVRNIRQRLEGSI
jgi:methionyl-tRNA formyltransferase